MSSKSFDPTLFKPSIKAYLKPKYVNFGSYILSFPFPLYFKIGLAVL